MFLADNHDTVWNGFFALIATVVVAVLQYRTKVAVKAASDVAVASSHEAAEKAVEVKHALAENTRITKNTETLVNDRYGKLLRVVETLTADRADASGKIEDIHAAREARAQREAHDAQQAIVDGRKSDE